MTKVTGKSTPPTDSQPNLLPVTMAGLWAVACNTKT